jgi:hypothetical protein
MFLRVSQNLLQGILDEIQLLLGRHRQKGLLVKSSSLLFDLFLLFRLVIMNA